MEECSFKKRYAVLLIIVLFFTSCSVGYQPILQSGYNMPIQAEVKFIDGTSNKFVLKRGLRYFVGRGDKSTDSILTIEVKNKNKVLYKITAKQIKIAIKNKKGIYFDQEGLFMVETCCLKPNVPLLPPLGKVKISS